MTNLQAFQELGTEDLFMNNGKHYFFDAIDETNELLSISSVDEEEYFRVSFDSVFQDDATVGSRKNDSYRDRMKFFMNNASFQTR